MGGFILKNSTPPYEASTSTLDELLDVYFIYVIII